MGKSWRPIGSPPGCGTCWSHYTAIPLQIEDCRLQIGRDDSRASSLAAFCLSICALQSSICNPKRVWLPKRARPIAALDGAISRRYSLGRERPCPTESRPMQRLITIASGVFVLILTGGGPAQQPKQKLDPNAALGALTGDQTTAALSGNLRALLLENFPDPLFEDVKNWGHRKENLRGKLRNDGHWWKVRITGKN